jgi:hypothetical protein
MESDLSVLLFVGLLDADPLLHTPPPAAGPGLVRSTGFPRGPAT